MFHLDAGERAATGLRDGFGERPLLTDLESLRLLLYQAIMHQSNVQDVKITDEPSVPRCLPTPNASEDVRDMDTGLGKLCLFSHRRSMHKLEHPRCQGNLPTNQAPPVSMSGDHAESLTCVSGS